MTCMSCAQTKAYPDGFPNTLEATCWECAWKRHLREHHPRVVRKARRKAEALARQRYRSDAHREVEEQLMRDGLISRKDK